MTANHDHQVIRIGVIGAGVMGGDHARLFGTTIRGATLTGVSDPDEDRAVAAAQGARTFADPTDLIASPDVDAVVVASPDHTHQALVLDCISAGKPVLCEKPMATDTRSCLDIVEAEHRAGRSLVSVGFMRRFDPAYRELKEILSTGTIGTPRLVHNQHRNGYRPDWFTANMAITSSCVHEIDVIRWLLDAEYSCGSVIAARVKEMDGDPILVTIETETGALVSTEVTLTSGYGYHIHCEVMGTTGTAALALPAMTRSRAGHAERSAFPENWIPRFADAYRLQNQAWIDALRTGGIMSGGATAWDGLVATAITEQLVAAAEAGRPVEFELPDRPGAPA